MDMHGLDQAMLKPLSDMNKGQSRKYMLLRVLNYFICTYDYFSIYIQIVFMVTFNQICSLGSESFLKVFDYFIVHI